MCHGVTYSSAHDSGRFTNAKAFGTVLKIQNLLTKFTNERLSLCWDWCVCLLPCFPLFSCVFLTGWMKTLFCSRRVYVYPIIFVKFLFVGYGHFSFFYIYIPQASLFLMYETWRKLVHGIQTAWHNLFIRLPELYSFTRRNIHLYLSWNSSYFNELPIWMYTYLSWSSNNKRDSFDLDNKSR